MQRYSVGCQGSLDTKLLSRGFYVSRVRVNNMRNCVYTVYRLNLAYKVENKIFPPECLDYSLCKAAVQRELFGKSFLKTFLQSSCETIIFFALRKNRCPCAYALGRVGMSVNQNKTPHVNIIFFPGLRRTNGLPHK